MFFVSRGDRCSTAMLTELAERFREVDRIAVKRVLDAVARHNVDLANVVAAELAHEVGITPLDAISQPSEHVAQKLGPTATAGR